MSDTGRDDFARYRERMAARGFRPRRRFGQNFLLDPTLHRLVVDLAGVEAGDVVLEIGAGLGFLTRELAARCRRVVAVEVDDRLAAILREDVEAMPDGHRIRLVEADALDGGRLSSPLTAALQSELEGGHRLVLAANLPYAVAGSVLGELGAAAVPPARGAVLVQYELAERLAAPVGSRPYGALSAVMQTFYDVRIARRVGREVFRPRPAVDSAVVALGPRSGLRDERAAVRREFAGFVRSLFQTRRKQLKASLPRACAAIGAEPPAAGALPAGLLVRRPGALAPDEHVDLWRRCRPAAPGTPM